jgi:hypothetical protein
MATSSSCCCRRQHLLPAGKGSRSASAGGVGQCPWRHACLPIEGARQHRGTQRLVVTQQFLLLLLLLLLLVRLAKHLLGR